MHLPNFPTFVEGLPIFPVVRGGKLPLTPNGWKDASADAGTVAAWERKFPGCNWAVACGLADLFVIDIDPDGLAWWEALLRDNPDFKAAVDQTAIARTPRGGLHVYFKGAGPSTVKDAHPGIDTRSGFYSESGELKSGGYVVLPGSHTSMGNYTLEHARPIQPMPKLCETLWPMTRRKELEDFDEERDPTKDLEINVKRAISILKNHIKEEKIAIPGSSDNTTFQVAASILDKGISQQKCFDLMWEHWVPHAKMPIDDWWLQSKIRSAWKSGEQTRSGSKGVRANADVFASFVSQSKPNEKAERPRKRRVMLIHDYAKTAPEPSWLIPDWLPAQGTGIMYGFSGSFKSFIALDMALCLAYGHNGQWRVPPGGKKVLYLCGESPNGMSKARRPAWMEWQGIEYTSSNFAFYPYVPALHDSGEWEGIRQDLADMDFFPDITIMDTMTRLLSGMDENSTKDANTATRFIEKWSDDYDCFTLALHHTGKDEKRGARGSSAFYNNLDTALYLQKQGKDGTRLVAKNHKEADPKEDCPLYFQVKEMGGSIVLERTEVLEQQHAPVSSKNDWVSPAEISGILQSLGGSCATDFLAGVIQDRFGKNMPLDQIKRKLGATAALKGFRDSEGNWAIPQAWSDL